MKLSKLTSGFLSLFLYFLITSSLLSSAVRANEGMWIPSVINAFMMEDMQSMGFKLTAEDVYSINKACMKDAIVHFGGGCTAEVVSPKGLIFTNHHCGYSQIQAHSSLENDYLKNGFWAKNTKEELPNPGLTAMIVVRIDDVTKEVLADIKDDASEKERQLAIRQNIASVIEKATADNHYEVTVKPFNYGNQYYMLVTETFKDVRLVGAPPSSIGKFGGDTDNWVWPRHTGDFSVFRIYADENNKPAPYNENNKPYQPKHFFPINIGEKKVGDFTMVYGFPGSTEQHLVSDHVKYLVEKENPAKINMRENSLSVIDAAMRNSDKTRIQYAAKQSRISNAYKKWIGQNGGLINLDAVSKKQEWEEVYVKKAAENSDWKNYGLLIDQLKNLHMQYADAMFARTMLIEYYYYGPEFLRFAFALDELVTGFSTLGPDELNKKKEAFLNGAERFYKDYDAGVDRQIFGKLTGLYIGYSGDAYVGNLLKGDLDKLEAEIYERSYFTDKERTLDLLSGKISKKTIKKIQNDKAFLLAKELIGIFRSKIMVELQDYDTKFESLMGSYVEGLATMFPERSIWPDANSTLRFTYGKIEGSAPHDGMEYLPFTTIDGIIQKNRTGNPDYELPQRLLDLYKEKKYGRYAQNGTLPVCFTASNHTTGGNSGSPVLDENGYYIGINFDRSWESTMSDVMFDPDRCRNIMVDCRYILWVIDVYAGAGYLLDEMELVEDPLEHRAKAEIERVTGALKKDPQNGALLYERARIYLGINRFKDAVIDLEAGLNYAPNHEEMNHALSKLYFETSAYEKAAVRSEHLVKHYKKAPHYFLAGNIRAKMGEWDKAYKYYEQAYKTNPNDEYAKGLLLADIMRKNAWSVCHNMEKITSEENQAVSLSKTEVCQ